jgi:hypothetical protein
MIIGISGKAGSGKDTAAKMLEVLYANPEISYDDYKNKRYRNFVDVQIVHFADALKETAMAVCTLGEDDVNTQGGKKQTIEWLGITVRELLQKLGTCIRESIDDKFWVKALYANTKDWANIIIADVRFPIEVESIKERGGKIIRIDRSGAGAGNHSSETALDNYTNWDFHVGNNGSLEELFETMKIFSKENPLDL